MTQTVIHIPIPPRTPKTAPTSISKSVLSGALTGGSVLFPTGCRGLVGIRIFDRDTQVFPDGDNWVVGDGNPPTNFSVTRRLEGGNFIVRIEGYNYARDWQHTPQVVLNFD